MPADKSGQQPVPAVGVVCLRGGEVLLIRRARPPHLGEWSIPGGRVERGETLQSAALRELFEETGVTGAIIGLIDVAEIIDTDHHYVLIDYAVQWIAGEPLAASDASEARFVSRTQALQCVTQQALRSVLVKAFA